MKFFKVAFVAISTFSLSACWDFTANQQFVNFIKNEPHLYPAVLTLYVDGLPAGICTRISGNDYRCGDSKTEVVRYELFSSSGTATEARSVLISAWEEGKSDYRYAVGYGFVQKGKLEFLAVTKLSGQSTVVSSRSALISRARGLYLQRFSRTSAGKSRQLSPREVFYGPDMEFIIRPGSLNDMNDITAIAAIRKKSTNYASTLPN